MGKALPFGEGAQCAHWAGEVVSPHPSHLRRATFPRGEGIAIPQIPCYNTPNESEGVLYAESIIRMPWQDFPEF